MNQLYDQMEQIAYHIDYNTQKVLLGETFKMTGISYQKVDHPVAIPGSNEMDIIPNYYPVLDGAEGPFDIFKEVQYDESQFTYALEGEHLVSLAGGTDGDPRIVAVDFSGYRSVDELVDVGIQVSGIIAVAVRFPTSCNCCARESIIIWKVTQRQKL